MRFERYELIPRELLAGDVLEFAADAPFNGNVRMMLINPQREGKSLALLTISGIHAGKIYQVFPDEAEGASLDSIAISWLQENLRVWIDLGLSFNDISFGRIVWGDE